MRRTLIVRSIQAVIVVLALVVWTEVGSRRTESLIIGTPHGVADWIWNWMNGRHGEGLRDLGRTVLGACFGFIIGVVTGLPIAVALASVRWLQQFAAPFVAVLNALPKLALAPLFILILGNTLRAQAYFVGSGILFIVFYNVFTGLRSIDRVYVQNALALGASSVWLAREVYAPAIVGWLMTSLRLMVAWALTGALLEEYLASTSGMGFLVATGQQLGEANQVVGAVLVVSALALVLDRLIVRIESHFSRWRLT
jgi:NitT/TauT family transport system permease protein